MQAKFLIPMAVSLAFGVVFATSISLALVPAGFMISEDLKTALGRLIGSAPTEPAGEPEPGEAR
jgi:hypothetical protein